MKNALLLTLLLFCFSKTEAQFSKRTIRVGLFTSLYLDQSFTDSGTLKSPKEFPRQASAGLEFYEGASLAIDSLNKNGISVKMFVFDIQSEKGNINYLMQNGEFEKLDMMIAQASGNEINQLALISKEFKIPFINATHPNDRGIRESPQVYVANPTINTHIEFLQQQLSSKWPNANILWFRRTDPLDNRMEEAFRSANLKKGTKKLQYKTIALPYNFITNDILPKLDTTKTNLVIAGSLDDKFAAEFLKTVREFPKKGLIVVVGMPNWESLKEMQLPKYAALPIYFSSPFYISPTNTWAKEMDELFKKNIYTKPSLSAYKGFELTYYFASLFSKHARVVVGDSTDNLFTPLNDLDFQPIKTKGPEGPVDYFENKKLYFLRRLNGVTISQ
jgi:ABC-type branched-subunit amino acid transport system substrate-binding protein